MSAWYLGKSTGQAWGRYIYEKQEFVGLGNQGATCYMNSLLQTLYMTPEFRREIYKWKYDPDQHGEAEDCIPLQLQLLFGKLQLCDSSYIDTHALTKSFQWSVRDGFQQHDVQEFCRVLFDAIEQSVVGTSQAQFIKDLYEGTYFDYVQCRECGYESAREDKFLDLSLTVRSDFEKVYNDSVEKALLNFVKEEALTGQNQYFCEQCQEKRDASKGLKFKSLPSVLVLQLKRFDFDYTTLQRIKLNDEVKFPVVLNMNAFVKSDGPVSSDSESEAAEEVSRLDSLPNAVTRPVAADLRIVKDSDKPALRRDLIAVKKQAFSPAKKVDRHKLVRKYWREGENVFELFSVMIHSGSALGGHYYAYIRSF